ncbi:hypothetical protein CesoFtcFv8_027772 [Champsocephalus esox]|uniref:Uncharacterized protein n=1 Tax=Champsocephalus esox TaxID=159716 RepID=A0AAN8G359_9TELE|nr:hypothetical protein CesoFtcFv8_027772 [Champsocephalus esox]
MHCGCTPLCCCYPLQQQCVRSPCVRDVWGTQSGMESSICSLLPERGPPQRYLGHELGNERGGRGSRHHRDLIYPQAGDYK